MLLQESLIYWLTVLAYTASTLLCLLTAWQAHRNKPSSSAASLLVLAVLGILLLLLGTNKIFNFLAELVDVLRITARKQGTYTDRQSFQFIIILILGGCCGLGAFYAFLQRFPLALKTLIFCVLVLIMLVFTRTVSLHQTDIILNWRLFNVRINWWVELGILLVSFLSAFALRNTIRGQIKTNL